MKVSELDLRFDIDQKIQIIKINNKDFKNFEGEKGTITNPFGEFKVTDIGIFLDNPNHNIDIINLAENDEIQFI